MPSGTVVITDCDHGTVEPERRVVEGAGARLRLEACATASDVVAAAGDADVLVVQYAPVDAAVLDRLPRCRAVVRYGVGVDTIDVEAATARGIWVVNVPGYAVEEVADHALALTLALLRGVALLDRSVRDGGWDHRAAPGVRRLSTLTLGVAGYGRIGRTLAEKAAGAGLRVLAHDPRPGAVGPPAEPVELDALLADSDAVSLHLPLTAATAHVIGADALASMRPGAYLVNTARGGLVDSRALLAALDGGRLAGAALDVFEAEPPHGLELELARHPRVIATPHAAWWSHEAAEELKTTVAREALRVLAGERPLAPVNEPASTS